MLGRGRSLHEEGEGQVLSVGMIWIWYSASCMELL